MCGGLSINSLPVDNKVLSLRKQLIFFFKNMEIRVHPLFKAKIATNSTL